MLDNPNTRNISWLENVIDSSGQCSLEEQNKKHGDKWKEIYFMKWVHIILEDEKGQKLQLGTWRPTRLIVQAEAEGMKTRITWCKLQSEGGKHKTREELMSQLK